MANSKDGQGHNYKYLGTSKKMLSSRNVRVQYERSIIYYLEVMTNVNLKNRSNVKVKRFSANSLALTVQKLLARLKF